MRAMPGISIIDRINNTSKSDDLCLWGREAGYHDRLSSPNMGVIIDSNELLPNTEIVYFNYNLVRCLNYFAIDTAAIFLKDGELVLPGVVCTSLTFKQETEALFIRRQNYFQVVLDYSHKLEKGIIVAEPHTSYRFNYQEKEYFFIAHENIVFEINQHEIKPGASYTLLEKVFETEELLAWKREVIGIGTRKDKTFYFAKCRSKLIEKGTEKLLIKNSDIYAIS